MKSIRPIELSDVLALKEFTDLAIGKNYYSVQEWEVMIHRSESDGVQYSLVLKIAEKIKGLRITFPPGKWDKGKGEGLSPDLWPHSIEETAYFQSLFIAPELTGQGLGKELSTKSIEALRAAGAKGIVCHSWKQSPHDSSGRYLKKLGFKWVKEHPEYWKNVDYLCTRCKVKPCLCTADEMYMELK